MCLRLELLLHKCHNISFSGRESKDLDSKSLIGELYCFPSFRGKETKDGEILNQESARETLRNGGHSAHGLRVIKIATHIQLLPDRSD